MMKAEPQECCVSMLLQSMNSVAFHIETPHHTTSALSLLPPQLTEQFMYQRDQHKNPSLSSYFDSRDRGTTAASSIVSPVSPLTTNVAMAPPPGRVEDRVEESAGQ